MRVQKKLAAATTLVLQNLRSLQYQTSPVGTK